jgi:MFS family permease
MLNPINSSMIATALVPIARDFDVSVGKTAVLVGALYVACTVAQPAMGRLGQVFGPRRVFLSGSILVVAGSVIGVLANGLAMLIVARIVIGIGTSSAFPNAMLMIRAREQALPDSSPGAALGVMSSTSQVTAAAGLPIGGILVDLAGWRSVFAFNIPFAVLCFTMAYLWIRRDEPIDLSLKDKLGKLDLGGMAIFTAFVGMLLAVVQAIPTWNITLTVLALVALAALVAWERRHTNPFIDVQTVSTNPALATTYIRTAITYATTYTMLYGYTQWLQDGRGLSSSEAGLTMLPMTVLAALIGLQVSRTETIRKPLYMAAVAGTVTAVGMLFLDHNSPAWQLTGAAIGFGVVLGFMSSGNQAALYEQTPSDNLGAAAGLYRTFIYMGAVASNAMTSVTYAHGVTDNSLRDLSLILVVCGVTVFLIVAFDRRLPARLSRRTPPGEEEAPAA